MGIMLGGGGEGGVLGIDQTYGHIFIQILAHPQRVANI